MVERDNCLRDLTEMSTMGGKPYPQQQGEAGGAVLLIDELGADETPILRRAELPPGDRAEARRQLIRAVLTQAVAPWLVGLIDSAQLPHHLFFVLGSKERDGRISVTEFAEHRGTERGRAIVRTIVEATEDFAHGPS